ncbi:hypothetical protein CsSME_00040928 [Camellia sinensis var. sinensis]
MPLRPNYTCNGSVALAIRPGRSCDGPVALA